MRWGLYVTLAALLTLTVFSPASASSSARFDAHYLTCRSRTIVMQYHITAPAYRDTKLYAEDWTYLGELREQAGFWPTYAGDWGFWHTTPPGTFRAISTLTDTQTQALLASAYADAESCVRP